MKRTLFTPIAAAAIVFAAAGCSGGGTSTTSPEATTQAADAAPAESRAAPTVAPTAADTAAEDAAEADEGEGAATIPWDGGNLTIDMDGTTFKPGGLWYGAAPSGGEYLMTIGSAGPADLEAYRQAAGAEEVGYITVDVDNRQGSELINMYEVDVFDASGKKYTYQSPDSNGMITQWQDAQGGIDDTTAYNQGVDLSNAYMNGASPHERTTMVLTGPKLPDEFTSVTTYPSGAFDVIDAVPVTKG